jgi:hypothetical protein
LSREAFVELVAIAMVESGPSKDWFESLSLLDARKKRKILTMSADAFSLASQKNIHR